MTRRTKQSIVDEICFICGHERLLVSKGSTEPKTVFILVSESFSLSIDPKMSKPEMAQAIVELAGMKWKSTCSSSGSTITFEGLELVLRATKSLAYLP
jgi:hypothetical protein